MREIKFKIIYLDKKEREAHGNKPGYWSSKKPNGQLAYMIECKDYVVLEYTGLKDKHGQDLDWWEGDLFSTIGHNLKIVFDLGCFWFVSVVNNRRYLCKEVLDWAELPTKIGTIREEQSKNIGNGGGTDAQLDQGRRGKDASARRRRGIKRCKDCIWVYYDYGISAQSGLHGGERCSHLKRFIASDGTEHKFCQVYKRKWWKFFRSK